MRVYHCHASFATPHSNFFRHLLTLIIEMQALRDHKRGFSGPLWGVQPRQDVSAFKPVYLNELEFDRFSSATSFERVGRGVPPSRTINNDGLSVGPPRQGIKSTLHQNSGATHQCPTRGKAPLATWVRTSGTR